jgi:hypothetical protein
VDGESIDKGILHGDIGNTFLVVGGTDDRKKEELGEVRCSFQDGAEIRLEVVRLQQLSCFHLDRASQAVPEDRKLVHLLDTADA